MKKSTKQLADKSKFGWEMIKDFCETLTEAEEGSHARWSPASQTNGRSGP